MSPNTLWQIGQPTLGEATSPGQRTTVFPSLPWTPEFDYHVEADADPIRQPHMPSHIGLPDSPELPGTTAKLNIHFTLDRHYVSGELWLIYDVGRADRGDFRLDGHRPDDSDSDDHEGEGPRVVALGTVAQGPHVLTLTARSCPSGQSALPGCDIVHLQLQALQLPSGETGIYVPPGRVPAAQPPVPDDTVSPHPEPFAPESHLDDTTTIGAKHTPHPVFGKDSEMAETRPQLPPEHQIATRTVLVIGGGAPNSALVAGALCAFEEQGVQFDVIYTSGAGALMGLLLTAPNGQGPREALWQAVEMTGVSDAIYRFFPVGYKTFFKPGPFTRPLNRWGRMFKMGQFPPRLQSGYLGEREDRLKRFYNAWGDLWFRNRGNAFQRLYNDWIDLCLTMMNPSDLNLSSRGMCASFPFLDELVDWSKLELFPGQFYINAYNITDQKMDIFNKAQISRNPEVFRAALAKPFIYPPVEVDGKLYIEGADHDPISIGNLRDRFEDNDLVKTVVVFDILSTLDDYILREPRNVWDAYQISIMAPIVSLARKNVQEIQAATIEENQTRRQNFSERHNGAPYEGNELNGYILNFEIPKSQRDNILDWSYSNLTSLWRIGYQTGLDFVTHVGNDLNYRQRMKDPLREEKRVFRRIGLDAVESY
ncbi:patatin-like phospholipase family protein [Candidatus Entotheonella palauensis]|uniref:PNPLA domain-containing protein n=1 Tax=Candidatus Entotheonella gemina TaxID=1429439 RepID=W4MBM2_9BACT|nr:patatin-like phospholipase family protein [Candidatus Entotheonella palauensis]ETX07749.1 MAG: hypothetical protein ETSY2_09410 [Candidatus Entotheonella gemina]